MVVITEEPVEPTVAKKRRQPLVVSWLKPETVQLISICEVGRIYIDAVLAYLSLGVETTEKLESIAVDK